MNKLVYWRKSTDKKFATIINNFLEDEKLTNDEFIIAKDYTRLWIKTLFDKRKARGYDKTREDKAMMEIIVDLLIHIDTINRQSELKKFVNQDCKELDIDPFYDD